MKTTSKTSIIMYEGDNTAESKQFESNLIEFFKMRRLQGDKIQIMKDNYDDRVQLIGVHKDCRKISMDSFISEIADMIGFEIVVRYQGSDDTTLINEEGFKLSATLLEA